MNRQGGGDDKRAPDEQMFLNCGQQAELEPAGQRREEGERDCQEAVAPLRGANRTSPQPESPFGSRNVVEITRRRFVRPPRHGARWSVCIGIAGSLASHTRSDRPRGDVAGVPDIILSVAVGDGSATAPRRYFLVTENSSELRAPAH